MKRILSYNVNGIRSAASKGLLNFFSAINPDVICLQETKAQPGQMFEEELKELGYHSSIFSAEKKGYSGVSILSKEIPDLIVSGINMSKYDTEGRFIRADFGELTVISAYIPSGTTGGIRQIYKMEFLEDFHQYLNELVRQREKLVICGDFNICRLWIDIHNPAQQQTTSGFLPEERDWFARFIEDGYIDTFREVNQEPHQYTWWSYRAGSRQNNKGWRIDYNIVSPALKNSIVDAKIWNDVIHSDHCPVSVDLSV